MSFALNVITLLLSAASVVTAALNPIVITGNAFYDSKTNDRFYIRGVDYLPGGSSNFEDPLANTTVCQRDIKYFQDLGLNTIRVYSVDNSANHDECMQSLDDAGIYLVLDVNTPKNSINRGDPAPSYNTAYLQSVFATIDAFAKYDNVLGFFAANEVINSVNTTEAAPYVKAVARDMKAYIKARNYRTIPVGYSAADIEPNRWQQLEYFNCGEDAVRLDMIGMNDYSWCGDSSFEVSGYAAKVQQYSNYTRPLFFSEYGCNKVEPRDFSEVKVIYSSEMTSVYSGGLVYEYSEEPNNYGLVQINSDGSITEKPDFTNLKNAFNGTANPTGNGGAKDNSSANACPAMTASIWEVNPNAGLPAMPTRASAYFSSGAGTPLGTNAPDTQNGDSQDGNDDNSSYTATESGSGVTSIPSGSESGSSSSSSSSSSSATSTHKKNAAPGSVYTTPNMLSAVVILPALFLSSSLLFGAGAVLGF